MILDPSTMTEIVRPFSTVSDKIRALDAAGVARADIARFLNKRYQHVRNVLIDGPRSTDRQTSPEESHGDLPESPRRRDLSLSGLIRLRVGDDGAITLPPAIAKALGLTPGAAIVAELKDDRLVLLSPEASIQRAEQLVQSLGLDTRGMADSLIEDRRREDAADQ